MVKPTILALLALSTPVWSTPQTSVTNLAKCTDWCYKNYQNPSSTCVFPALTGQGPCYVCGPLKTSQSQQVKTLGVPPKFKHHRDNLDPRSVHLGNAPWANVATPSILTAARSITSKAFVVIKGAGSMFR
ncbi:uncharacterized protein BO95DRAFT_460672 [Aspergillus brunneoviolaceus CBS 621.78]|uniref:Uncharacterized protein n=1 Tax=Aspergillus brunneoviolaceus CBS 621.78 TaxID=1450534 RepID=A0ACD1GHU7_9EURO|nr:hypothetical protein BO95DRAFT_460672 [Aspergillus brunneoviolaceus CBS 621.78]RAH48815.1 hypothetical protein BO95DRAFT_460672 [Aspergillus brunneoviolaceus CBS 621.78]